MRPRPLLPLLAVLPLLCLTAARAQTPPNADDIVRAAKAGEAVDRDFSGAQAPGLTLSRANLAGVILRRADLRGCWLTGVSLEKANLQQANLRGAVFERVDMPAADLSGADLSGALFRLTNLENANLSGCLLDGVTFEGAMLSQSGASHLVALQLALQRATGQTLSRAWVAGLSGDAFAFCYNERDPGSWPGVPFTVNPMLAAPANMGLQAGFHKDVAAEKILLDKLQAQTVHLLLLKLPQADDRLTGGKPLWGWLMDRPVRDTGAFFQFNVPPLGEQELRRDELFTDVWGGPWDTTEPPGEMRPARRQLVAIQPGVAAPQSDQALKALAQALAIITEKRTYGPLIPGEAGLTRLASDLRRASQSLDSDLARRLVPWQGFPRHCLIGSLGLATEFLGEAALALGGDQGAACQQARAVLRSAATALDTRWPQLAADQDRLSPKQVADFAAAADLMTQVAAAERKAADIFATLK